jgi:hypothetical protein
MAYGYLRAWLDIAPVPDTNWTHMSAVDAMSRTDEIGFMSFASNIGEPTMTVYDAFEILHKAPAIPAIGIGVHETDPAVRADMVAYLQYLFADSPSVKRYVSEDGGITYTQV